MPYRSKWCRGNIEMRCRLTKKFTIVLTMQRCTQPLWENERQSQFSSLRRWKDFCGSRALKGRKCTKYSQPALTIALSSRSSKRLSGRSVSCVVAEWNFMCFDEYFINQRLEFARREHSAVKVIEGLRGLLLCSHDLRNCEPSEERHGWLHRRCGQADSCVFLGYWIRSSFEYLLSH